jgi:hypothetical protein
VRTLLLLAAVLASGCSVLTQFDPEGQPCDLKEPDPALQCLSDAGFSCVAGACRKLSAFDLDAGR